MRRDNRPLKKCPRCGKNFPLGKWCECGYQESVVYVDFSDYLSSLTIAELKLICKMNGVKLDTGWGTQRKSDIIDAMDENNDLRVALGFPKK